MDRFLVGFIVFSFVKPVPPLLPLPPPAPGSPPLPPACLSSASATRNQNATALGIAESAHGCPQAVCGGRTRAPPWLQVTGLTPVSGAEGWFRTPVAEGGWALRTLLSRSCCSLALASVLRPFSPPGNKPYELLPAGHRPGAGQAGRGCLHCSSLESGQEALIDRWGGDEGG